MSSNAYPYDQSLPAQFLGIKLRLEALLSDVAYKSIEQIRDTSVPGLAAKPIIDVTIVVAPENVRHAIDALVSKGNFVNMGELGARGRWYLKDPELQPEKNVYVCVDGSLPTRYQPGSRDTQTQDDALRGGYAAVELELTAKGTNSMGPLEGSRKSERVSAIKTERLLLREFVEADEDPFFELESQEGVVRYQMWPPRTRAQAHDEVTKTVRNSWAVPRTHVELAVEHEGKFIGRVGANVRREGVAHVDLWFSFLPAYQGKGLAAEAMSAFIPLLGSALELEIECDPRNTGSWKLAERLGFEKFELTAKAFECKGEWVDSLVYRKRI
ncbi:acyl-CoA N-acyltransferase [Bimuria novae-zelandiae CBS 107.79]|uniref:Acyl-CoA N-acyltransferase n=1 Tax=Bimuria novae-zelandiae CBS 107.79 TaxID=1447943 RepID=A0A6A5UQE3_9PLEO|nr:acyl-CoA N-acyltransferase [Bimuria novae-zelandiae CBS 107.79]